MVDYEILINLMIDCVFTKKLTLKVIALVASVRLNEYILRFNISLKKEVKLPFWLWSFLGM